MTPTILGFSDYHKNIRFINLNNFESISFDETNPNKIHMTVRFILVQLLKKIWCRLRRKK